MGPCKISFKKLKEMIPDFFTSHNIPNISLRIKSLGMNQRMSSVEISIMPLKLSNENTLPLSIGIKTLQVLAAAWMPELPQGLSLNLSDPFPGHIKVLAHFLQCMFAHL